MASLLSWLGNTAKKVEQQINPFDGGATYSHPALPPRPLPQAQPAPQQRPALSVGVAAPQMLHMGNQTFAPNPNARTSSPAVQDYINKLLAQNQAPKIAPIVSPQTALGVARQFARSVPELGATVTNKTYHPGSRLEKAAFGSTPVQSIQQKVVGTYQGAKKGAHPNLALPAAIGEGLLSVANDLPAIGVAAKGIKAAEPGFKAVQASEAGFAKLPKGVDKTNLAGLTPERVAQIKAKTYSGPNLNKAAFTTSDKTIVGDSMTREAKQITAEDRQFAKIVNISPGRARTLRVRPSYPNQREVMVNKTLAGKNPTELPPTPNVSGDLKPPQNIPIKNKLFSNKINAIRKIGTPNAHALADTLQTTDRSSEALRAGYMSQIPTVQKLSKGETAQMFDVVEKKLPQKNASPNVIQAAKEWKALTPKIAQNAFKEGAIIGNRKNYVPHNYSADFWTKRSGSQYDSAIQHLMDTNKVDHEGAVKLFDNLSKGSATRPSWFGNFENSRMTDLPGYAKDKATLYKYVEGAAQRTASAQHLGLNNEVANKLLQNIRMEGGDMVTAKKAVENYLRSSDVGPGAKSLRTVRGVFGFSRLGKAAVSHAGQTSNTAVDAGIARTVKGWGQFLRNNPAHKDFVAKTGVTNPQVLHAYQDQYTSVRGLMSKGTAPGLNQMMKVNRSVTALAYRSYGNALAKAGNEAELRKLGVTGKISNKLTPAQELQTARGGVNRTMFSPSRATTPIYAETPAGKTIGQYRTAYGYKQTGFVYNQVIKEAANGNLKPLYRFLAVSAPVAGGTIAIKNKISGNKEGPGGIAMDALGALGGIPGEAALQLGRYGARDLPKAVAGTVAPLGGEAITAAENLQKALKGDLKPLGREALGMVPIAGSRVAKAVLPPKSTPVSKTAPNNTTTTTNAKGKTVKMTQRQIKGNATDRQAAWENFTAKARANIRTNNPDLYVKRQTAEIQKEQATGNITKAFKDTRDLQKLQITRSYDKNLVGAYNLNATDFKAYLTQATPDQISQLQNLDAKLVDSGLVAKTKFTKATGYASRAKSTKTPSGRSGSSKTAFPASGFKTAHSAKVAKPKGVSVKKLSAPSFKATSTRKLSVSKIPISYKSKKIG